MKNSIIPFSNISCNRFSPLFAFLAVFTLLFSACEQNDLLETDELTNITAQRVQPTEEDLKNTEAPFSLQEATDLTNDIPAMTTDADEVTDRSRVKVYENFGAVNRGKWKSYYLTAANLPDPSRYKLEVVVTPLSGDPDLYFYGYDNGSFRYVRASAWTGVESLTFRKSGLLFDEEYAYIGVKGYSTAQFKIEIYRVAVDCIEYPTANQQVTLEYRPVCGCDGQEYPNPSSAYVTGVTSWTYGPCCSVDADCVSLDGCCLEIVANAAGQTTILDGHFAAFSAPNIPEGLRIMEIMEHYNIDQSCFIGRPNASMTYVLSNGQSPVGALAGEDCLSFNPNNLEIRHIGGNWILTDPGHISMNFENNRGEAEDAKCIIQQHGFTQRCFVGRPSPSLEYFRK